MDDKQLSDIESFAVDVTRNAGAILLEQFGKPMDVQYKSEHETNPVTEVDKRSEEYIKEAILRGFPSDSVLAEEGSEIDHHASDIVWVVDPLDGTVNYLNGVPLFGVSVGVLQRGRPVVGCIFIPSPQTDAGNVFHARLGGGAFRDSVPIRVAANPEPQRSRISVLPASYARAFRLKDQLRRRAGEVRSPGSVAYELAMTACGAIQYAAFSSPWVWDVAAGLSLITEAQGVALMRRPQKGEWEKFEAFTDKDDRAPSLDELKKWRTAWIFGNTEITHFVTANLRPRGRLEMALDHWVRRLL